MSETKYFGVVVRSDLLFLLSNSVGDALSLKKKNGALDGGKSKSIDGSKNNNVFACLFVCLSVCLFVVVSDCVRL